jgi:hypothetical protein
VWLKGKLLRITINAYMFEDRPDQSCVWKERKGEILGKCMILVRVGKESFVV